MRFVIAFFGLIGATITFLTGGALIAWNEFLRLLADPAVAEDLHKLGIKIDELPTSSMTGVSHPNAGLFIALAGVYGFLGAVLTVFRCGRQGGALMIVPVLFAGFLNPYALPFMSVQLFVGLLALFIGPLPITSAKKDMDDDEDEDEEEEEEEEIKPKARRKR